MISAEEDEWMMDDPLRRSIEHEIESPVSLFWCLGIDDAEAIHHSMDMRIDTDIWHIVENREHDFGCLDTDTWECLD